MPIRLFLLALALIAANAAAPSCALAEGRKVRVVATFSILADMVRNVGGAHVSVVSLVGVGSDPHAFRPRPNDAAKLRSADLVVENGAGFENWIGRLVAASGYRGPRLIATSALALRPLRPGRHEHRDARDPHPAGEYDPHAWHDPRLGAGYIAKIADGLCQVDTARCADYKANARAYAARLLKLDTALAAQFSELDRAAKRIVTSHDSFRYFGARYLITILAARGISTDEEPSARQIAALIRQVRAMRIRAYFIEVIANPRLIEQIARETGLKPGGRLYSDSLSAPDGPAATYLDLLAYNARQILAALAPTSAPQ